GIFSTLRGLASHQNTQKLFENGIYLAGRYMDGATSASRPVNAPPPQSTYENPGWFRARGTGGFSDIHHEQELRRLHDMENRLQQMERDMRQNNALARAEIDSQRRERYKLEQELEAQKAKVKDLEKVMEQQQQKQQATQHSSKSDQKSKVDSSKNKNSNADNEKSSEKQALLKKDATQDPAAANAALIATVGVVSLVMSLYSAHKASSTYSVVTFHDQLRALMEQCESVIQSTEAWISEQFLDVPDQIHEDLKLIKELLDIIHRIDPRSEKKASFPLASIAEALAWSMSAVGSLGAVGGAFIGSMTAMASGGTVVIGCALYGIISRARFNGPEYGATKTMMEVRASQILRSLGVDTSLTPALPARTTGKSPVSIIHDNRIERLRIEFERRDGHDLRDADEIDGLEVEEALRESSFSAPFVSTRKKTKQSVLSNPLISYTIPILDWIAFAVNPVHGLAVEVADVFVEVIAGDDDEDNKEVLLGGGLTAVDFDGLDMSPTATELERYRSKAPTSCSRNSTIE
ncbi:hypothetical protein BGW38_002106, partial [Lunasporangiospora selenospora]